MTVPYPKPQFPRKKPNQIPPKIKKQVQNRDKGICQGCGRLGVHLHHIIFRSQGGKHELDNLVTLCPTCHMLAHTYREHREKWEKWRESISQQER